MSKTKKLKNDCFALPAGVDWTPLDDALLHLETSLTSIIETEAVPINLTVGRILASDLKAGVPTNVIMDTINKVIKPNKILFIIKKSIRIYKF